MVAILPVFALPAMTGIKHAGRNAPAGAQGRSKAVNALRRKIGRAAA